MARQVTDAPERHRYELLVEGRLAGFAAYSDRDQVRVFTHTEVDPAYAGQGLASTLVQAALDDVRQRGLRFVAVCPFVRSYLQRHPEQAGGKAG